MPDAIETLLGEPANRARESGVVFAARRALAQRPSSPLATLTSLLLLGDEVPATQVDAALPQLRAAGLVTLGIATSTGDALRAALSLNPVLVADSADDQHWWIISDLDDHLRGGPARTDHVMGVGGATRSLIAQLSPAQVPTALDLGTGCGIVALHLALRSERVVATDISERALMLGRANARLNGYADRIEFRLGDLFAPVEGEQFALIASNPPFVITPRNADEPVYEYRDGGRAGDALAADVVGQGPRYLAPGGTLVCLANWESPWGGNGLERVRGWIAAAEVPGLAAWVIERDRLDPLGYAQMWARDGGERPGSDSYNRRLAAWLNDFDDRRVVSVGLGSIRVQRIAGETAQATRDPLVHLEQATGAFASEQAGATLAAAFDAGVRAALMTDAEVLDTQWLRDDAVVEHREHEPGVEAPRAITLETSQPISRRVAADPLLAAALGACDGELTMGQIADALATLLEIDAAASRQALIASARELSWLGMLTPAN
nr:methyltransferase [Leucobacter exalbidus]